MLWVRRSQAPHSSKKKDGGGEDGPNTRVRSLHAREIEHDAREQVQRTERKRLAVGRWAHVLAAGGRWAHLRRAGGSARPLGCRARGHRSRLCFQEKVASTKSGARSGRCGGDRRDALRVRALRDPYCSDT